jgi:hypothetical protein
VHYRLTGDTLQPEDAHPFGALDGRLLWVDGPIAGAAITEGTTLFAHSGPVSLGGAWPEISSMAAFPRADGSLRAVTLGPGPAGIELREGILSAKGLTPQPEARRAVAGACAAVFEADGGPGVARSDGESIRIEHPSGAIEESSAPGACVEAALGIKGGVIVLTGPVPTLHWLEGDSPSSIVLGDLTLGSSWLPRRLTHDAGRQRVWAVVGARLVAIDRTVNHALRLAVTEASCSATSVTLVDGK